MQEALKTCLRMKRMGEQGACWPAGSGTVTDATLSLSVLLSNTGQNERRPVHLVSLAPGASRTQSRVSTHPARGPLRKTLKGPLDWALPRASCAAAHGSGRARPVRPGPPLSTRASGHSAPADLVAVPYAERRDGDLSGVRLVGTAGRRDAVGADLRGPPSPDAGDRVSRDRQGGWGPKSRGPRASASTLGAKATSKVARGVTAATARLPVAQRAEAQA